MRREVNDMPRFYLGLDNGGTTTKAALYDERGNELGSYSVSTDVIIPRPDFVERDMEEMWDANCRVIRGLLERTGADPADIRAAGICGHGKGLYLWGKDGRPARNGIVSTDNRAYAYPMRWRREGVEDELFPVTCQHILASQPVSLLAWLRDNEPGTWGNIKYVFSCKDYVRFRLTGEAAAEVTDLSGNGLIDLNTGAYDDRILKALGLTEIAGALPPVRQSAEVCGYVTREAAQRCGLKEGTPVAGGMFDIDACALSAGVADTGHVCMVAGTWSINEFLMRKPVLNGKVLMNSMFCLPGYYLVEESSPTSAANLAWYIEQFLPELAQKCRETGSSIYDETNAMVASISSKEFCPVFLPFIMASNAHPNARASMTGMTAYHTRAHLTRSIYEGITFSHKWHYDKLRACMDKDPVSVRLVGGAARSRVWTQMFADTLALPVETSTANETGALGSAIAAAAAVGDYPDLRSAMQSMTSLSAPVMPDPGTVGDYSDKYKLYVKTINALDTLWDAMQRLAEK